MPETLKPAPIGADALDRAIDLLGLTALANRLGVAYQLIQGWRDPSRRFATPAEYVLAVEQATGRRVKRHDLRPDVFPAPARKSAKAA